MTSANANPSLHYADIHFDQQGTPESRLFDDIYFSRKDGVAESNYVFIHHNDLPTRFSQLADHEQFLIAETGFGSGLNFLLAADLFLRTAPKNAHLYFVSFEKYPLKYADLAKILSYWPQFQMLSELLLRQYPPLLPGLQRLHLHPQITLDLYFADVNEALPEWVERHKRTVHAWFLDGFAPQKNPQMWQPELFQAISVSMANQATLATFSATGDVRRGLIRAGLHIKKAPGFGKKREMLYGTIYKLGLPKNLPAESIAIIGDGIAAASLAYALKNSVKDITVFSAASGPAAGASGNPQGAVYPLLQAQWTPTADFFSHAHEYARQLYCSAAPSCWHETGVQQLSKTAAQHIKIRSIRARALYPSDIWLPQTRAQASQSASLELPSASLLLPKAGWVPAKTLVSELFEQVRKHRMALGRKFEQKFNCPITSIQEVGYTQNGVAGKPWALLTENNKYQADQVIIAGGERSASLLPQALVPIRPVRGQITQLSIPKDHPLNKLTQVLCHNGYITPATEGTCCIGATFDKSRHEAIFDAQDDKQNLNQLEKDFGFALPKQWIANSRASVRATTPDHLPLAGRAPRFANENLDEWPNLWILSGLGARGLTSAPLAAELIAAQVEALPLPATARIVDALKPIRFAERAAIRKQSIWVD